MIRGEDGVVAVPLRVLAVARERLPRADGEHIAAEPEIAHGLPFRSPGRPG